MGTPSGHSGEMSQDSMLQPAHRMKVRPRVPDPATRTARRAYNALNASSVGLEMGLSVIIGLLVGYYMDRWLGTEPWLMLGWLVLGLIAGFRGVLRAVNRAERAANAEEATRGRP